MRIERVKNFLRNNLAEKFAELGFTKGYEIGVHKGIYSEILCKANTKLCLKSVDPYTVVYQDDYSRNLGLRRQESVFKQAVNRLKPYNCEIIKKTSLEAVRNVPYETLDFVYIDGSHQFDYAMADIIEWTKRVKKGGIVSGHDYDPNLMSGVVLAVKTYAEAHNIEVVYLTSESTGRARCPSWWFIKQ